MGCCESCLQRKDDEQTDRLLPDGDRTSNEIGYGSGLHVPRAEQTPVGSEPSSRLDEQTLLNGILTKYSTDMVDVTAIDSRIDAVEYMNRVTMYNRKLASISNRLEVRKNSLRSACQNPVPMLSGPPPRFEDVILVSGICDNVAMAMGDIRVLKKRDLTIDLAKR